MSAGFDALGDRMKAYEAATDIRLNTSLPICARVDGRSFSRLTAKFRKPFDSRISGAMRATAAYLVEQTHAKIGYVQSDEITLIWQAAQGGSMFFDGRVLKLASVCASMASVKFHGVLGGDKLPSFDCRVWQVPSQTEAANVLVWRALDARKNAISSACRSHFSTKQMYRKDQTEMRKMLSSAGVDFDTDYPAEDRQGAFFRRVTGQRELDDETWARIPENRRPPTRWVVRSWVDSVKMPFFTDVTNREAVVFDGAVPETPPTDTPPPSLR